MLRISFRKRKHTSPKSSFTFLFLGPVCTIQDGEYDQSLFLMCIFYNQSCHGGMHCAIVCLKTCTQHYEQLMLHILIIIVTVLTATLTRSYHTVTWLFPTSLWIKVWTKWQKVNVFRTCSPWCVWSLVSLLLLPRLVSFLTPNKRHILLLHCIYLCTMEKIDESTYQFH